MNDNTGSAQTLKSKCVFFFENQTLCRTSMGSDNPYRMCHQRMHSSRVRSRWFTEISAVSKGNDVFDAVCCQFFRIQLFYVKSVTSGIQEFSAITTSSSTLQGSKRVKTENQEATATRCLEVKPGRSSRPSLFAQLTLMSWMVTTKAWACAIWPPRCVSLN